MIRFNTIVDAAKKLERQFGNGLPWMYIFTLYRHQGKRLIFQYLLSLPSARISATEDRNLTFMSSWKNDTVNPFRTGEGDPLVDEILGVDEEVDKQPNKIDWIKINASKSTNALKVLKAMQQQYGKKLIKSNKPFNTFSAEAVISLREVNRIDMYTWGFEISTDGPIEIVAVRGRYLRDSIDPNSGYGVGDAINDMIGKEFELPSTCADPKTMVAYWNFIEDNDITDNEIDKLLEDEQKREDSFSPHMREIGGKVNKHLDI